MTDTQAQHPSQEEIRRLANASASRANTQPFGYGGRQDATPSPSNTLRASLLDPLSRWVRVKQAANAGEPGPTVFERAEDSLRHVNAALAQLGDRKGAREDAARAWLTDRRTEITSAMAAVESIGADFTGPRAVELTAKVAATQAAFAAASRDVAEATHTTVEDALLALEHAKIDSRDLDRELAELIEALRVPHLPHPATFAAACNDSRALEALPGKNPRSSQVAEAIRQGLGSQATEEQEQARISLAAIQKEAEELAAVTAKDTAAFARLLESTLGAEARKAVRAKETALEEEAARKRAALAEEAAPLSAILSSAPAVRRLLWVVYETKSESDHELLKWRAKAAAEIGQ